MKICRATRCFKLFCNNLVLLYKLGFMASTHFNTPLGLVRFSRHHITAKKGPLFHFALLG